MLYQWTYLTLYLVFSAISEAATDYPFSIFNFFLIYVICIHLCIVVSNSMCLTVTRRVSLVELALLPNPEHRSSSQVLRWVRVAHSLVFCVVLCRLLFFL